MLTPAVFLDRDGVINVDVGYAHRPEQLILTPSAAEGIAMINRAGARAIVVTNQSGVARGYFDLQQVDLFHRHLSARLARHDARIDAFYVAPWLVGGTVPEFAIEHEDRKPGSGMLLRAIRDWSIDPAASVMIGDKPTDAQAAHGAGVRSIIVPSDLCDLAAVVSGWLNSVRAVG